MICHAEQSEASLANIFQADILQRFFAQFFWQAGFCERAQNDSHPVYAFQILCEQSEK